MTTSTSAPSAPVVRPSERFGVARVIRRPAVLLAGVQIAAILAVGVATVARFHLPAPVDEAAHVAYVQTVAQSGRLPVMGRDTIGPALQALKNSTYPRPSPRPPQLDWEAFQPPLYYVVAAPVLKIPAHNLRTKIYLLRAFDLLLLIAGVVILALLARAVFARAWLVAYCCALSVVLWPGVLTRGITVSNAALEFPLASLTILALWKASIRRDFRWLIGAGALVGLCVLTQLVLVCLAPLLLVPVVMRLRVHRDRRSVVGVGLALILPLIVLAPWLISNESRYGALTSTAIGERVEAPIVETGKNLHGLGAVNARLWRLTRVALPSEWWGEYRKLALRVLLFAAPALLLAMAFGPLLIRPSLLRSRAATLLAAPALLGLATIIGIVLFADWPAFQARYLNPMLPLLGLFAAWAWSRWHEAERWLLGLAAAFTVLFGFVWVYMAGAFYFTRIGASLGIHA